MLKLLTNAIHIMLVMSLAYLQKKKNIYIYIYIFASE